MLEAFLQRWSITRSRRDARTGDLPGVEGGHLHGREQRDAGLCRANAGQRRRRRSFEGASALTASFEAGLVSVRTVLKRLQQKMQDAGSTTWRCRRRCRRWVTTA